MRDVKVNLAELIKKHSEPLISKAKTLAEDHANAGIPNASESNLSPYIQTIKTDFMSLWAEIEARFLDSESLIKLGDIEHAKNKQVSKMQEDKYRIVKSERDKNDEQIDKLIGNYNWKVFAFVTVCFLSFVLVEGVFNSSFLQVLGGISYELSMILGSFLYILVFLSILWFQSIIEHTDNPVKKRLYRICFFTAMAAFIIFTSYFRMIFIQGEEGGFDPLTLLGLIVINSLVFIGLLYLHRFLPSKEQIENMLERRRLQKMKHQLEEEMKIIKENIDQKTIDNMDVVSDTQSKVLTIEKSKEYLISYYEKAVAAYVETNIKLRRDRLVPNCFTEAIPNLNI